MSPALISPTPELWPQSGRGRSWPVPQLPGRCHLTQHHTCPAQENDPLCVPMTCSWASCLLAGQSQCDNCGDRLTSVPALEPQECSGFDPEPHD